MVYNWSVCGPNSLSDSYGVAVIYFWLVVLAIVSLLAILLPLMILESNKPTFSLKKDEWHCTEYKTEVRLMHISSGKVTSLLPMSHKVCVQWSKK